MTRSGASAVSAPPAASGAPSGPPRPGEARFAVRALLVAANAGSLVSAPVHRLTLDLGGVVGDRHHGIVAPAGGRHARFYPRGTPIRNRRQVSVVSAEELAEIASRLGVPEVRPEWLGANMMIEGYPRLSALPAGARLLLPGSVGLVCEGVNQPCRLPALVLQERFPASSALRRFVRQAYGRRGIDRLGRAVGSGVRGRCRPGVRARDAPLDPLVAPGLTGAVREGERSRQAPGRF